MKHPFLLLILIISVSCKQQMSESDRKVALEDFKSQEVRRVNKSEIFVAGFERGKEISTIVQNVLNSRLTSTINEHGAVAAIAYCNVNVYPIVDSLSKALGADIKRTSMQFRNPEDAPDQLEAELLDAYQYSIEVGTSVSDNIQEYDSVTLIYTKPIVAGQMCLACHGTEVETSVKNRIAEIYPNDKALNHKLNDLRGMWSIKLSVKEIVNSLE